MYQLPTTWYKRVGARGKMMHPNQPNNHLGDLEKPRLHSVQFHIRYVHTQMARNKAPPLSELPHKSITGIETEIQNHILEI